MKNLLLLLALCAFAISGVSAQICYPDILVAEYSGYGRPTPVFYNLRVMIYFVFFTIVLMEFFSLYSWTNKMDSETTAIDFAGRIQARRETFVSGPKFKRAVAQRLHVFEGQYPRAVANQEHSDALNPEPWSHVWMGFAIIAMCLVVLALAFTFPATITNSTLRIFFAVIFWILVAIYFVSYFLVEYFYHYFQHENEPLMLWVNVWRMTYQLFALAQLVLTIALILAILIAYYAWFNYPGNVISGGPTPAEYESTDYQTVNKTLDWLYPLQFPLLVEDTCYNFTEFANCTDLEAEYLALPGNADATCVPVATMTTMLALWWFINVLSWIAAPLILFACAVAAFYSMRAFRNHLRIDKFYAQPSHHHHHKEIESMPLTTGAHHTLGNRRNPGRF